MLDVQQALEAILADNPAAAGQPVPLADALGLVLASDIASDIDSPPHDKSMVDGYAVKQLDLAAGPVVLTVNEEVTAGQVPTLPVQAGTASRIMTGAPVSQPDGNCVPSKSACWQKLDMIQSPRLCHPRWPSYRPATNLWRPAKSLRPARFETVMARCSKPSCDAAARNLFSWESVVTTTPCSTS